MYAIIIATLFLPVYSKNDKFGFIICKIRQLFFHIALPKNRLFLRATRDKIGLDPCRIAAGESVGLHNETTV